MTDEPTLGELARRLEDRVGDIRDDIQNLVQLVDKRVSMERYQLETEARDKELALYALRIKGLEDAAMTKERQRQADRRLILTGLVVPVLLVLLQVYLATRGAGS